MSWIHCARVIQVLEEHVTESNNGDGMITEKPEGKKTESKIFTQDKEAIKIFHAANNFQPVLF